MHNSDELRRGIAEPEPLSCRWKWLVAGIADLWLRPRLGTDAAIALAMIKICIDEGLGIGDRINGYGRLFAT